MAKKTLKELPFFALQKILSCLDKDEQGNDFRLLMIYSTGKHYRDLKISAAGSLQ